MAVLEITTRIGCKVACSYCPQKTLIRQYAGKGDIVLSLDTYERCLQKLPLSVDLVFCGMSEPWTNPDCTKMVLMGCERGHKVSFETTLRGMTPQDLDDLGSVRFGFVAIHLASAGGNEDIDVSDEYLSMLRSIASGALKTSKLSLHYYADELHPRIKTLGLRAKRFPLVTRAGVADLEGVAMPHRHKGSIVCRRGLRHNVLLPNGDVVICSHDYGMKHVIGNLVTDTYSALFESEEFRKIEDSLSDGRAETLCRYCDTQAHGANALARTRWILKRVMQRVRTRSGMAK